VFTTDVVSVMVVKGMYPTMGRCLGWRRCASTRGWRAGPWSGCRCECAATLETLCGG